MYFVIPKVNTKILCKDIINVTVDTLKWNTKKCINNPENEEKVKY